MHNPNSSLWLFLFNLWNFCYIWTWSRIFPFTSIQALVCLSSLFSLSYVLCCWPKYFVIAHILLLPKISLGSCWLGRLNTGGKKWRGSDVLVFRTNLRLISKPALLHLCALTRCILVYTLVYQDPTLEWAYWI